MQAWQMKELARSDVIYSVEARERGRVVRVLSTGVWVRWGMGAEEHIPWSAHRHFSLSPVQRNAHLSPDDPPEKEQRRILAEISELQRSKRARCERGDVYVRERQERAKAELDDDDQE